jgi:hypothetical protein
MKNTRVKPSATFDQMPSPNQSAKIFDVGVEHGCQQFAPGEKKAEQDPADGTGHEGQDRLDEGDVEVPPDLARGEQLPDPRQHIHRGREEELDLLRLSEDRIHREQVPDGQHREADENLEREELGTGHSEAPSPCA